MTQTDEGRLVYEYSRRVGSSIDELSETVGRVAGRGSGAPLAVRVGRDVEALSRDDASNRTQEWTNMPSPTVESLSRLWVSSANCCHSSCGPASATRAHFSQ